MKKKKIIISLLITILIALGVGTYLLFSSNTTENDYIAQIQNNINEKYSDVIVTDFETAKESIVDVKEELNVISVDNEFIEGNTDETGKTINTYRLKQTYNGVEVYYGGLTIYTDKNGKTKGIINEYVDSLNIDTVPKKTDEELKDIIKNELNCKDAVISKNKLIIYPLGSNYVLAHEYKINSKIAEQNIITTVIISDETKEILDIISPISTITDDEIRAFYQDDKFLLYDTVRSIGMWKSLDGVIATDDIDAELYSWKKFEESSNEDNQLGLKSINTIQRCYDYYDEKFNYLSIDGKGNMKIDVFSGIKKVSTPSETVNNFKSNAAFTAPNLIMLGYNNLYNDNVEVLGHEYTHGVFYYTVGETSSKNKQGDALNEAYADIMGMCIESYYNGNDKIDGYISSKKGRDIKNSKVKYQDMKDGLINVWIDEKLGREEHYYSKIISKAAYIMSQTLTVNELENLWFDSMKLLGEDPNFYDCVYAVMATAREMGISEDTIKNAFNEVGLTIDEQSNDEIEILEQQINSNSDNDVKNSELKDVYAFAIKNNTSIIALKADGTEIKLLDINIQYDCMDYSYGNIYLQKGNEFYKIDLTKGNGNYKIESIYKVTSDTEWYNKLMTVYDGKLYYNKASQQIVEYDLLSKKEKILQSGKQIEFRIDKNNGIMYYTLKVGDYGIFGLYNIKSGEEREIRRENDGLSYYLGTLTKDGIIYIRSYLSQQIGYEYNFKTNESKEIVNSMTLTQYYDYDSEKLYYEQSVFYELLTNNKINIYDRNASNKNYTIFNAGEESITQMYLLKNGKLQIIVTGGQDISTYYTKTYLIDTKTFEQTETNTTYNIMEYIEDGSDANTPKNDTSNTTQNNFTNDILIGKWKATNTNSAEYSLGYIFGSSISMNNILEFKEDGTYTLGVGFTYNENGNYEIQGDVIKLTNIKYVGDSPDATPRENAEFKIKQENETNKIILEHKQDEYISGKKETLSIELIFDKSN